MKATLSCRPKPVQPVLAILVPLFAALLVAAVASATEYTLLTTATAYNSVAEQTDDTPNIAAWGDILEPGMRVIAVSRDLLAQGLSYGVPVTIDGLPGEYVVLDKMSSRWTNKIDIFMGNDIPAAREWGRRQVTIRYWKTDAAEEGMDGDVADPAEADTAVDPDAADDPVNGDMALPPAPGESLASR